MFMMKIQYTSSKITQESQRFELGSNQAGNGVWNADGTKHRPCRSQSVV